MGNVKFGLLQCCWVCSERTSCSWNHFQYFNGEKAWWNTPVINSWTTGKKESYVTLHCLFFFVFLNIPVLLHLPGKSHCFAFHRCAELLSPAAFLKIQFKRFALMLTPENDDHLSKTLIRKNEKSVSNANHDMYSAARQAYFIPDRYGWLMQSHRGPEDLLWRAVLGIVFN